MKIKIHVYVVLPTYTLLLSIRVHRFAETFSNFLCIEYCLLPNCFKLISSTFILIRNCCYFRLQREWKRKRIFKQNNCQMVSVYCRESLRLFQLVYALHQIDVIFCPFLLAAGLSCCSSLRSWWPRPE